MFVFGIVLILLSTLMHVYVIWRVASVPFVKRHVPLKVLIMSGAILWGIFCAGRIYGHYGAGWLAVTLEFLGMNWMATLFLIFILVLAADIITLFGFAIPRFAPSIRGWALIAGVVLSVIALFQGFRPPVIQEYEVSLPDLPGEMDGTVLVALSDLHVGSQIGEEWLADRVAQVQSQSPDIVVLLGDILEGHGPPPDKLISTLARLSPPLGVWAVSGNHAFHGGSEGTMSAMEEAGFHVLRDCWAEVRPGLVITGVDDLTTRRRRGEGGDPVSSALNGRPPGATIMLSHTPWEAERVAEAGAGLMLCGHTHGGQIWPFDYLVRIAYPLVEGRYEIDGMAVIVSRGAGTWGPRMRLWHPGEILRVTLREKKRDDTTK